MKGLNVLSLFDGIAIGRLALQNLSIPISSYHAFEIDKPAMAVTAYNFPEIIQHGNVENIVYNEFNGVDLLIGGSPCQDLSQYNNDRLGLQGKKSSLFYYYAEALHRCGPKYFMLENVANMRKTDESIISRELGCEPYVICSSTVSGQTRKRCYWTNLPRPVMPSTKVFAQSVLESGTAPRDTYTAVMCHADGLNQQQQLSRIIKRRPQQIAFEQDATGLYVHGDIPYGDKYFYRLTPGMHYHMRRLHAVELERLQTIPDDFTKYGIYRGVPKEMGYHARYHMIGNSWTVKVIEAILASIK